MAWLNVIINEDLYDHDFVEYRCYGFDQLAERVQDYPPDKVADTHLDPRRAYRQGGANLRAGRARLHPVGPRPWT